MKLFENGIIIYAIIFVIQHLPDGHRGHMDLSTPAYRHVPESTDQDTPPTTSRSMPKRAATVDHPPTYDSAIGKKK